MSANSSIEWTDNTWNPIRGLGLNRWQCQKISPGCDNCYASTMNHRWGGDEYLPSSTLWPAVRLDEQALSLPSTWKTPRRVFVCSMTDLFGEWVPPDWQHAIFEVMRECPQHQFQVLTKRPSIMQYFARSYYVGRSPLPNVWLGVSIEDDRYCWRAEVLKKIPAAVRFISAEPLIGPLPSLPLEGIDWLIAGGESGSRHRPMDVDWVRELRDASVGADPPTAFFFKQWGGRTHAAGGRLLDGRTWDEYPA